MTRTLLVRLITLGDPERLSGGYLYHRRLAQRLRVVPPGRDAAAAPGAPAGDLRAGRRAALLCVANCVERKGILETPEALARLDACAATLHLAGDDRADPRYAAAVRARLSRRDLAGRVVVHGP